MTGLTVVQREATWLSQQAPVASVCGSVLPYARRLSGDDNRRVTLRRSDSDLSTFDLGHDLAEHTLALRVDWPANPNLVGAQQHLDQAVDTLLAVLHGPDRTHGGLWADSADSGDQSTPDIRVSFTDPDDPVALAADGRLQAVITYTVTEITPRG